ncbi:hypothetical protein DICPUDRAFT_89864 [Dictyostelium purpureum]|uniref:Autophagy-related protein 2 n=1 Tax=Dictyostelium purpureum TaxID=5786 RepID=F0ZYN9_DICPU|nr:uncharacterized protein DICPUDRAFT_89864 [Dictyostelium purpureum]EGC30930.1 hypothetical protein DICPUDRAFT_89864 [Dictyostelium purpureum]|eukprot:XP_003292533.1 hypothetical protein DICPUDRAFT_89864 [Dictyostelium purpureum]
MWTTRAAKFLFKKICGEYFMYELEKDQFKIAFKKGTINLNNLELNIRKINKDLQEFSPLMLASGYIGNLTTMIPYYSILDTPSEFNISNLELTFVSRIDYTNFVLEKLKQLRYLDHLNNNNSNNNNKSNENSDNNEPISDIYSDEDEEIDKIETKTQFGMEGLEALTEILKKLIDKVSAKIEKCTITIVQYDTKRNKTITIILSIDSIEYKAQQNDIVPPPPSSTPQQQQQERLDYFLKSIVVNNISVLINDQFTGNIMSEEKFYNTSIFNIIPKSNFNIIFSNKSPQSSPNTNNNNNNNNINDNDIISLKIKKSEKSVNEIPLFLIDCFFKNWTLALSPQHLTIIEGFISTLTKSKSKNSNLEKNEEIDGEKKELPTEVINANSNLFILRLKWQSFKLFLHNDINSHNFNDFILHQYPQRNYMAVKLSDFNIIIKQNRAMVKRIDLSILKLQVSNNTFISDLNKSSGGINNENINLEQHNRALQTSVYDFICNTVIDKSTMILDIYIKDELNLILDPFLIIFLKSFFKEKEKIVKKIKEEEQTHQKYLSLLEKQSIRKNLLKKQQQLLEEQLQKQKQRQQQLLQQQQQQTYGFYYPEFNNNNNNNSNDTNNTDNGTFYEYEESESESESDEDDDLEIIPKVEESSSIQISLSCSTIRFRIKFPTFDENYFKDCSQLNNNNLKLMILELQKNLKLLSSQIDINFNQCKITSNIINDIPDVKWFIDFDSSSLNLYKYSNNINQSPNQNIIIINTKNDSDLSNPVPIEITIRGIEEISPLKLEPDVDNQDSDSNMGSAPQFNYVGQDIDSTDYDEDDYDDITQKKEQPPGSSSPNFSHFNPFSKSEKHKGPFSKFVSTSEGTFDSWLDEAEQEEINLFRHTSIESSKYVVNLIIPFLKLKLTKSQYLNIIQLSESYSTLFKYLETSTNGSASINSTPINNNSNSSTPMYTPNSSLPGTPNQPKIGQNHLYNINSDIPHLLPRSPKTKGYSNNSSIYNNSINHSPTLDLEGDTYSLFSLMVVINSGSFIIQEDLPKNPFSTVKNNSSGNLNKSTSTTALSIPPQYQYELAFEKFEIFYVSQYYGKDISFVSSIVNSFEFTELNLSQKDSKPIQIFSKTMAQRNLTEQILSITISINNDTTGFLDSNIQGNIYSIIFKGVTIHHRLNTIWFSRVSDFFSPKPNNNDKSNNRDEKEEEPNDNSTNVSGQEKSPSSRFFINFVDTSISYTPSEKLSSAAVLFFSDVKLKIPESGVFSVVSQNSYIYVLDNVQFLNQNYKSNARSSILNHWKLLGFVPVVHLDYIEFDIINKPNQYPSLIFDYNHNLLSINACSDSFFTINQLINNFLGLDLPIAEVADLIITQGIGPDLKENIDILINEDTFKQPIEKQQQQQQQNQQQQPPQQTNPLNISQNSSYSPAVLSSSPSPTVPGAINFEFEEISDDRLSGQNDFSDDDGSSSVYEYYSPLDMMSSNSKFSETESNSSETINDIPDTLSQASFSNLPIMGSIMIEDYDHDKIDTYPPSSTTQMYPHRDFYNDTDPPSNESTQIHPQPQSQQQHSNDGTVTWMDQSSKTIEPVENYITNPDEDPSEDCSLPHQYPKSSSRVTFRKMNISIKIFKGSDWERDNESPSLIPSPPTNNSTSNKSDDTKSGRDQNFYVEFLFSNCSIRIDKFDENELYAKRMSIHIADVTIMDHIPTSVWNKFLCSDTNVTRYSQSPMIKILLETVRPDLSRPLLQENRLKVLILPIRFNVDQDTVSFIVQFLSYKPRTSSNIESPKITSLGSSGSNISPTSLSGAGTTSPLSSSQTLSNGSNTLISSGSSCTTSTNSSLNSSNNTQTSNTSTPVAAHKKTTSNTQTISRSIPEEKAHTTDKESQEITYFQSVEILPIRLKVDYKPKKVDYHSLTSGNYAELLNLLPLEGAIFNLSRLKLNGVGGWSALFNQIGKIWVPYIIQTQLLGYVSGVRGLNSLVHIGEGLANLIILPYEQYKKDGNILKGIKRGTTTFLKNLTVETLSMGAKVAVGTQGLLETADNVLSSPKQSHNTRFTSSGGNHHNHGHHKIKSSHHHQQLSPASIQSLNNHIQQHSHHHGYASKFSDQPNDTREGIQHAYESVSRELKSAAHTIIAIPMKEYHKKGTKGYVKSIVQAVPIAIIRPMIGITEGVSKTLLGVRNQIDPLKKMEMDNKYKQKSIKK